MPINFNQISSSSSGERPSDPIALFQSLRITDPAINDLWLAQGDALRAWNSHRSEEDIAITLNTGAGKTLVGLLAAQATVNEIRAKVLYVCSSIQLVKQTAKKAFGYGLDVTTYYNGNYSNNLYQRGLSPCITTYQAVFNCKSRFSRELPGAIIFDDAHTAEHLLRSYFTLTLRQDKFPDLYAQIIELFRSYYTEIGLGVGYEEINRSSDINQSYLLPPFALFEQLSELNRLLLDADLGDKLETMFSWDHLRDKVDLCTLLISGREIAIIPPVIPVSHISYFQGEIRRIYLSATLTTDDKFIRTFGKKPRVIAPQTTAGECERLILIPSLNHHCEDDIEVAGKMIKNFKALILLPSYRRLNDWSDVLRNSEEVEGENLIRDSNNSSSNDELIESFKSSNSTDKLPLVSCYDGVDLPGDTCRIMVIDDLPTGLDLLERYKWERLSLVKSLRSIVASRVIQGFGRISRGMSDYGVVIITGKRLKDWLLESRNRESLPPFLRRQIELGIDISEQAELEDLLDSPSQCLNRDEGWISYYQKAMEASIGNDTETDADALYIAETEANFIKHFWSRSYEEAALVIHNSQEQTFQVSSNTAAWHLLWLGYCYERQGNIEEAHDAYQRSHSISSNIPPLNISSFNIEQRDLPTQVKAVSRYLHHTIGRQIGQRMPKKFNSDLAALAGNSSFRQTEEAIRSLGTYLGLESSRPDNEYSTGPDVLWVVPNNAALNLEVKTNKEPTSMYRKDELGQLRDHEQWIRNNIGDMNIISAFVGPHLTSSSETNPSPDMLVIDLSEFQSLAERLRSGLEDICTQATPTSLANIVEKVFRERALLWPDFYESINKIKLVDLARSQIS